MQVGVNKCAHIKMNKGKQINSKLLLERNNLTTEPVADGDTYKYLGQDENVDVPIKTSTKLPHNKRDILIWDKATKTCSVIEITCSVVINITQKINEKLQKYASLLRNLTTDVQWLQIWNDPHCN